jgi:NNP family nitrate/nitrite transporter-like MFS transporter
MTKYYVGEYGFDIKHAAFLAACFSLPGGVLRAMGGWLSDRFGPYKVTWGVMWTCWVAFFILSYPQTDFSITTTHGVQSFHIGLGCSLHPDAVWRGHCHGHRQGLGVQVHCQ